MITVTYKEVKAEVFIEFRNWLIEFGNHCGYLSYNGNSYRGIIIFEQSLKNDTKENFLMGIEKLSELVKVYS